MPGVPGYGGYAPRADGGSAFPIPSEDSSDGMSLRDWFAGLAMQSMVAGPGAEQVAARDQRYDETNWDFIVATNAYNFADAMLRAREKNAAELNVPEQSADDFDPDTEDPTATSPMFDPP